MLLLIKHCDVEALYWINNGLSRPWLDAFFSFVTELRNYVIPAGIAGAYLWFKGGARGRRCLLALLLCVGVSDQLSSRIIKPLAHRLRPCAALPHVLTPHGDRGTYSFPSSHAVNIAGATVILGLTYPILSPILALLALLVGLSRIYLGLHYPTDVLTGYLIGGLIGWMVWEALRRRFAAIDQAV